MGKIITFNHVYNYIESHGDTLLSKTYVDNKTKLEIKCKKDHIFKTPWKSYYNANSRCPICAIEKKKLSVSKIKKYLESKGDFLASSYVNAKTKITLNLPSASRGILASQPLN